MTKSAIKTIEDLKLQEITEAQANALRSFGMKVYATEDDKKVRYFTTND